MIKRPRWIVLLYVAIILVDWLFAYLVQDQPGIIVNSWSVVFPVITFFYGIFSTFALIGMYQRIRWGYSLGYITIVGGAILASISYLYAYQLYSIVQSLFIGLLIANLVVVICMLYYCLRNRIFPN